MEWVETSGRTIEEAKDFALDQLGVDESDAEFEVVNDAKIGIFGRVRTEARVRARVRPSTPRAKDNGNRRRRKPEKERTQRQSKPSSGAPKSEAGSDEAGDESSSQRPPRAKKSNSRRRAKPATNSEGASPMEEEVALDEQGDVARDFLSGLFEQLGSPVDIDVSIESEDELVLVDINGDNLGHLIGPRGVTLHAVQELTRTVVQRKTGARNGRIIVDIARYREKRRIALEKFTKQVAEEVLSGQTARTLEPMNPADRKIVHDTINGIDGVSTTSEGEEPRRRVVIKPGASA